MPNVKIYVEEQVFADRRDALTATLKPIRDMLCADLKVDIAACQFAVLPVMAMPAVPAFTSSPAPLAMLPVSPLVRVFGEVSVVPLAMLKLAAQAFGARAACRARTRGRGRSSEFRRGMAHL